MMLANKNNVANWCKTINTRAAQMKQFGTE